MTRVLILHASVGAGHHRAAEALAAAFAQRMPGQIEVADVLDYANPLFRRAYVQSYVQLTDKLPALWGYVYAHTDRDLFRFTSGLRTYIDRVWVRGLRKLLQRYAPRVIVCTHFLPVEILSQRKGRAHLQQPLYCVLTDYAAHAFWSYRHVDRYFVATEDTRTQLIERGIASNIVQVTGIPVSPALAQPKSQQELRPHWLVRTDEPLIVLFGGGLDAGRVRTIVKGMLNSSLSGTLVVVAGRNASLLAELNDLKGRPGLELQKLGMINKVDDLIVAADLVVTKAGGLIVSEVLARGRPMVIFDPIPGQEESNTDYLVGTGAAVTIRLPQHVPFAVEQLLHDRERLTAMSHAAHAIGRPRAALDIAEQVLSDIGERPV
jgi:processive 1,2-diacylglycerol beta-glucosyltransferase